MILDSFLLLFSTVTLTHQSRIKSNWKPDPSLTGKGTALVRPWTITETTEHILLDQDKYICSLIGCSLHLFHQVSVLRLVISCKWIKKNETGIIIDEELSPLLLQQNFWTRKKRFLPIISIGDRCDRVDIGWYNHQAVLQIWSNGPISWWFGHLLSEDEHTVGEDDDWVFEAFPSRYLGRKLRHPSYVNN